MNKDMDKYKKVNIRNKKKDIEMQIIEWFAQDESLDESEDSDSDNSCRDIYTIRAFGMTSEGISVTCKINNFTPFYYVKVSDSFNDINKHHMLEYIESSWNLKSKVDNEWVKYYSVCLIKPSCKIINRKDLYGFNNGKVEKYLLLVFNNQTAMNKSKYIFKKSLQINGVTKVPIKYKLYESGFDPFMRFCHIKDIRMAGWIKIPENSYEFTKGETTTQLEVEIHWKNVISLPDKTEIANYLQASWDIETYSYDGSFPDPNAIDKNSKSSDTMYMYPNVIYQIASTFKYYQDENILAKHLLTLKKCDVIEGNNVVIEECDNEEDLIKRWIDLMSDMDPDILYTYNGDSFDCMYIFERAKLYNLASKDGKSGYLFEKLSRLRNISAISKKDYFSSSAYGDSDFVRFYIPGRLNYDLLIHYKRGMVKYPSYKLDYISNEILKEGKNNVTPKQIFSFYKEGKPDQIKTIGEYCIQDTELLQKLVDKQLILITIIQLANVTYVPIGFLTTRGQTIKVYSQLLRKARQMKFLVPDTNFNENTFPVNIKCREYLGDNIETGKYIEVQGPFLDSEGREYKKFEGLISEIINDNEFIVLSDIDIDKEYTFKKFKLSGGNYKNKEYSIVSLYPSEDIVDNSFTGATVLNAEKGMYKENIAVLDFASLYPTIMISRNLCYSTFVMDNKYLNIKDVVYENIKWDDKIEYKLKHTCQAIGKTGQSQGQICGKQAFFDVSVNIELDYLNKNITDLKECLKKSQDKIENTKIKSKSKIKIKERESLLNSDPDISRFFCRIHDPIKTTREDSEKFQKKDISYDYNVVQQHITKIDGIDVKINQGVIPALLEELYTERKRVKKRMAKAAQDGDKLLEDILNSTQLAIKVSLNSTYGYLGRKQGNLILKPLGSIVTSVGRTLIEQSKEYAENAFLEYIKNNNLATHRLEIIKDLDITNLEKQIILDQFKI